jgi:hypothetical protein
MSQSPKYTSKARRGLFVSIGLVMQVALIVGLVIAATQTADMAMLLWPVLATLIIFILFAVVLRWRINANLFGDLGFLYMGLTVAYTVLPVFAFMIGSFNQGDPLAELLPEPSKLSAHIWRHVLFMIGVSSGYLLLRGRETVHLLVNSNTKIKDDAAIFFLIGLIAACIFMLMILSGPVQSYYDHYIRYDHLPPVIRKFASLCIRLSFGFYTVLFVFLFLNYKKYRLLIPFVVTIICAHEVTYSFGSRIQALIILLQVTCLYNYTVKPITIRKGVMAFIIIAVIFTLVELFRSLSFDFSSTKEVISDGELKSASEFGAVFFTGFHLYAERASGALPPTEWPMFFNEFISLFTFGDFVRWNSMDWYWKNYYPLSIVAPFTLGPIADSAIWGGEVDLLLRSIINGVFFAYIVRWFLLHKDKWWGVTVYVYCYATCILTLKYGIFNHLNLLSKNILPTLVVVGIVRILISYQVLPKRSVRI